MTVFGCDAFAHDSAFGVDDCGGVALWLPPGVHADDEALQKLMMAHVAPEQLGEMAENLGRIESLHPDGPYWYLAVLAADPARQGSGLGSKLLEHQLREVDKQGLPASLESSNPLNVSLYRRYGFERHNSSNWETDDD